MQEKVKILEIQFQLNEGNKVVDIISLE